MIQLHHRAFASALAGAFLVSACGGGGSGDSNPQPDAGGVIDDGFLLNTPDGVVKALYASWFGASIPSSRSTLAAKAVVRLTPVEAVPTQASIAAMHPAKTTTPCTVSGTQENVETTIAVEPPMTQSWTTFSALETRYDSCVEKDGVDDYAERDGLIVYACSPETDWASCNPYDGDIEYYQLGTADEPFRLLERYRDAEGHLVERDIVNDGLILYRLYNSDGRHESYRYSPSVIRASVDGVQKVRRNTYGTPDALFHVTTATGTSTGDTYTEEIAAEGMQSFSYTDCSIGSFRTRTIYPLLIQRSDDGHVLATLGGMLRFDQGDLSATVEFTNNGSLLVTAADGRSKTYDSLNALEAAGGPCKPLLP